ncbi:dihydrofolate reductase [Clostridium botulinum]|nr:dihydrofolate reductase [Clostridium botulinum]
MISIIVARDSNNGIGKDNKLLFHIKEDMKRFKDLTTDKTIIMGSKTFDSLPNGVLPNRFNIVLTNNREKYNEEMYLDDIYISNNIDFLIKEFKDSEEEVFIIGGESIYKQFLLYANKIYLTEIHDDTKHSDSFFNFNENEFKIVYQEDKENIHGLKYSFINYERFNIK